MGNSDKKTAENFLFLETEINAEVLEDLRQHEDSFRSNPAATTFHSAYSAAADSVPTLQFPTENPAEDVVPKHQASQG